GHFDHGGGLKTFLDANTKAPVYIHPRATGDYYGTLAPWMPDVLKRAGIITRKIGIDRALVGNNPSRIVKVEKNLEASGGVWLIPEITRTRPLASGNRFLFERTGNSFSPDSFLHEMILAVAESDGVAVFSGCAHSGIMNMILTVKKLLGKPRIKAVVGGFHLCYPKSERSSESSRSNMELAEELGRVVDGPIFTGHCTGSEAFSAMKQVLGDRLVKITTGSTLVV
ncbi:MAG: MBL fold metallo-hydrolase, partial [Myxococcota bacterium]